MPENKSTTSSPETLRAARGVISTPHQAQTIDGDSPHLRYAVAVTENHGLQVHTVDEHDLQPAPFRAIGQRVVSELDSFLSELERRPLGDAGTLWGSAQRGSLTAIYNDHTSDFPGWRDDKLALQLAADPDWHAWHALSGNYFRQQEFGDKIEELLHTIVSPDQAELLEVIDSIRASSRGEVESGIERANGGQRLVYKQEHTVRAGRTGQIEVPQIVGLELRPWDGHPQTYPVEGYFRVRVNEGQLNLAVKLKPTRQIVRTAWADLTAAVTNAFGKPVYAVS